MPVLFPRFNINYTSANDLYVGRGCKRDELRFYSITNENPGFLVSQIQEFVNLLPTHPIQFRRDLDDGHVWRGDRHELV